MTITPARAARRKLLTDRITEHLEQWGSPHAADRAVILLNLVDDAGLTFPEPIEDTPPRTGPGCTDEARQTAMQQIRDTLGRSRR